MNKKYFLVSFSLIISFIIIFIAVLFYFTGGTMEKVNPKIFKPEDLTKIQLEIFRNKTILFGHQSVRANIVIGLREISDSFNIIESEKSIT